MVSRGDTLLVQCLTCSQSQSLPDEVWGGFCSSSSLQRGKPCFIFLCFGSCCPQISELEAMMKHMQKVLEEELSGEYILNSAVQLVYST